MPVFQSSNIKNSEYGRSIKKFETHTESTFETKKKKLRIVTCMKQLERELDSSRIR